MAGVAPTFRDYRIEDLIARLEPGRAKEKDTAYEFSNGRKFESPGEFGGVYVADPVPNPE